jgi:hypothetical protein
MKEWGDEKLNSRKGVVVVVLWWLALVDFWGGLFCKGGWNWGTCRRESLESRKKIKGISSFMSAHQKERTYSTTVKRKSDGFEK